MATKNKIINKTNKLETILFALLIILFSTNFLYSSNIKNKINLSSEYQKSIKKLTALDSKVEIDNDDEEDANTGTTLNQSSKQKTKKDKKIVKKTDPNIEVDNDDEEDAESDNSSDKSSTIIEKKQNNSSVETDNDDEEESSDSTSSDNNEETEDDDSNKFKFKINGNIEFENFFNTDTEQDFADVFKKNEFKARLKMKYGNDSIYFYTATNIYFLPVFLGTDIYSDYKYTDTPSVGRNLRLSLPYAEITFNELYFNYTSDKFRLRVGNQIYGWGTADSNNPTSYFNTPDMRELILKDGDEAKNGIPSLSSMIFLGKVSIELVWAPIPVPTVMAPSGNFWSIGIDNLPIDINYQNRNAMELSAINFGYGARVAATVNGFDFSFSGYWGPDKDSVMLPWGTTIDSGQTLKLDIIPQQNLVGSVGFDFSKSVDKFVFQVEIAYSPNKTGLLQQDTDSNDVTLPYETKQGHYLSYSAGVNYFVPLNKLFPSHQGNSLITLEWTQAVFFDTAIQSPMMSGLLLLRYDDSFLEDQLTLSFTMIFDLMKGGMALWPKLGWDFQNGLKIEIGYVYFTGMQYNDYINISKSEEDKVTSSNKYSMEDSVFYYLKKKDVITLRLSYEF